jgi:hypothetical protein
MLGNLDRLYKRLAIIFISGFFFLVFFNVILETKSFIILTSKKRLRNGKSKANIPTANN